MQVVTHDTLADLADILEQSVVLDITDHGGIRMYVLEFDGNDILIFENGGVCWSVYPNHIFDVECGGSIHDHARAINAEAGRAPAKGDAARDDCDA